MVETIAVVYRMIPSLPSFFLLNKKVLLQLLLLASSKILTPVLRGVMIQSEAYSNSYPECSIARELD